MDSETPRYLQYTYLVSAITSVVVLLYVVWKSIGQIPAIKGLYILIGLGLSVALYIVGNRSKDQLSKPTLFEQRYWLVVTMLLLLSFPITQYMGTRVLIIVAFFPAVYALIAIQILYGGSHQHILAQILAVFFTSIGTKYLDTHRYFGNGDLLRHAHDVGSLMQAGTPSVLGVPYQFFFGLHILSGAVGLISRAIPYDAILLTGIICAMVGVLISYLIGRSVFGSERLGLLVALSMTMSYQFQFFSVYIFPQSMAVILGYLAIFLAFKADLTAKRTALTVASLVVMTAMVSTHHFTFILFTPVVIVLVLARLISGSQGQRRISWAAIVGPRAIPLITGGIMAIGYWRYNPHSFFAQLSYAVGDLLIDREVVASSSSGPTSVHTFGTTVTEQTVQQALMSIVTPNGIYFVVLLTVFSLGIAEILSFREKYRRSAGILILGIGGSLLILKTPLALSIRLGHPFTVFFAAVLAAGFSRLCSFDKHWRAITVIVILLLGTTTPMVAGDDLYGIHQGPDFYGSKNIPDPQREFSKSEYESMRATAQFVLDNNQPVTSLWMSSVALSQLGTPVQAEVKIEDCTITTTTDRLFYRNQWTDHQVYFNGARNKMIISQQSLKRMVKTSNQIHTTGETGILANAQKEEFNSGCM